MDINFLQEFSVLAQSETFLKAADTLFISQPTLSRHIKNLETELGVPLFERTTRSSKLTKYGDMLLPYAKQIVEAHNQFISELLAAKSEQHQVLRISSIPALDFYGITNILTCFKELHESIKMDIVPSYTSVIEALRRHDCELAFIREQENEQNNDIVRLPLTRDHMVAVVPETHPLAAFDAINLSELKNENIITISRETVVYDIVRAACVKAGFEPNIVMTDHNIDHIIHCVQLGMGAALLMNKHTDASRRKMSGLKILDVQPVTGTLISLCYMKHTHLSDAALEFIQVYKDEFELREPTH